MDFDHEGEWDEEEQEGPAIHAPENIRNIVVSQYRIEWLNISEPDKNFYAKNQMVATLVFTEPQFIAGEAYLSARISMELERENKVVQIVAQEARSTFLCRL